MPTSVYVKYELESKYINCIALKKTHRSAQFTFYLTCSAGDECTKLDTKRVSSGFSVEQCAIVFRRARASSLESAVKGNKQIIIYKSMLGFLVFVCSP